MLSYYCYLALFSLALTLTLGSRGCLEARWINGPGLAASRFAGIATGVFHCNN